MRPRFVEFRGTTVTADCPDRLREAQSDSVHALRRRERGAPALDVGCTEVASAAPDGSRLSAVRCRASGLEMDVEVGCVAVRLRCPACATEVRHPDMTLAFTACPACYVELSVDLDEAPIVFAGRVIG